MCLSLIHVDEFVNPAIIGRVIFSEGVGGLYYFFFVMNTRVQLSKSADRGETIC